MKKIHSVHIWAEKKRLLILVQLDLLTFFKICKFWLWSQCGGQFTSSLEFSKNSSDNHVNNKSNSDSVNLIFSAEIKAWSLRNNVSHNTVTDLLQTLRKIDCTGLLLSAKSLLVTSGKKLNIQTISSGSFLYRGIQNFFEKNIFLSLKIRII